MRRLVYFLVAAIVSTLPLTINVVLPEELHAQQNNQQAQDLGNQDRLRLRQQAYLSQHSDSSGNLRPGLWEAGVKSAQIAKTLGPITGVQWTQIGPAPLRIDDNDPPNHCETLFQGSGPDSGQVVDIAVDPSGVSDQTIYLATNDGGIWKTTDGGATWSPETDFMPTLSMGAVALDPGNSSTVYAGTGNNFTALNGFFRGVGIYKSTDGGNNWTVLNPNSIFTNVGITRMVLPAPNVLLVATSNGLFKSVDGGQNFGSNSPTFNNGNSILTGFITDLHLDTATATTVYAAVNGTDSNGNPVAGAGLLKSTDSGSTFPTNLFSNPNAPTTFALIMFAQSTQPDNQTIYANVQAPTGGFSGLYKSANGGGSWAAQASAGAAAAADNGCQCGYDQTVGVDPQDANRVYIGFQELYLSTDGGGSFGTTATENCLAQTQLVAVTARQVHWDHHALIFSPQSHWGAAPTRLYVGTDGGIATSGNGGTNWSNINEGISTNLFNVIDIGRGSAGNNVFTYGGSQDTGLEERKTGFAGNDWHLGLDGDGGGVAVDPLNPMRAYGADDGNYVFTNDGGNTWVNFFNNMPPPPVPSVYRFAVDPNSSANIFATTANNSGFNPGNKLYRSTDTGASFQLINTFTPNIKSIANVTSNSNVLWVGLTDGTVQFTTNALTATPTWTARTVTGAPAMQPVAGIAIDQTSTSTVVVVYPGFTGISQSNRTKHAFMTTDSGMTWNDISGTDGGFVFNNLPDLPLHAVVIDPNTTPHNIIVAGDTGVMRTIDLGKTWHALGVSLPTVDCTTLAIDASATPGLLRVGTYGRSVFELALGSCTLTCPNIQQSTDPNQCGATVNFTPATTGTCGTVTCTPPSGSFFPKGTTTVICLSAGPSCSFTVTVNDTEPPKISCPSDITATAAISCPIATSVPVSFTVTASDNCLGVTFVCKDQNNQVVTSGQSFPVGTTTVTCTATDTSGNTATCQFIVTAFSFCLQDETNHSSVVLVNAQTGEFRFCCGGVVTASGIGTLTNKGCIGSIDSIKGNRQVHIQWDTSAKNNLGAGTAYLQKSSSAKIVCQITDKNMSDDTCQCP